MIDRQNENWRNIKLRQSTKKFLEALETTTYEDYIEALILFGSEARGEARGKARGVILGIDNTLTIIKGLRKNTPLSQLAKEAGMPLGEVEKIQRELIPVT